MGDMMNVENMTEEDFLKTQIFKITDCTLLDCLEEGWVVGEIIAKNDREVGSPIYKIVELNEQIDGVQMILREVGVQKDNGKWKEI